MAMKRFLRNLLGYVAKGAGGKAGRPGRLPLLVERLESREVPAGGLDTAFSGDGKQTTGFNLGGINLDVVTDIAIQSDGKIVAVGYVDRGEDNHDFGVVRYKP